MVWGMVFPNGQDFVKEIFGKQNSEKYEDMLSSFAVTAIESKYGKIISFNRIIVRSTSSVKLELSLLKWPARCPDLNLIENV